MPYPQNLEARAPGRRQTYARAGAIPATIAGIDGRLPHLVCERQLADGAGASQECRELSRADMAALYCTGGTGATTVAAT